MKTPRGEGGALDVLVSRLQKECREVPHPATALQRKIRRKYSALIRELSADEVLRLAHTLCINDSERWVGYELVANHETFRIVGKEELERLGRGINSWWTVDSFARILSGPAWLRGQISDDVVHKWAKSPDVWWRRAALVSTVALNLSSDGGTGDTRRTLAVCRRLVNDHEDMIVKAISWALRVLAVQDPESVAKFLERHRNKLASRVLREVTNKLRTGLKRPKGARS